MQRKRNCKLISVALALMTGLSAFPTAAAASNITLGKLDDGDIRWKYDARADTLTLTGEGDSVLYNLLGFLDSRDRHCEPDTIILNGIRTLNYRLYAHNIVFDKTVESFAEDAVPLAKESYEVDADNPWFADYAGGLYNKDLTYLYHVPSLQREVTIADTVETLDEYAIKFTSAVYIVIPWGTRVAEGSALDSLRRESEYEELYGQDREHFLYPYVILPDTLHTAGKLGYTSGMNFIYSEHFNFTDVSFGTLYPTDAARESDFDISEIYGRSAEYLARLGKSSIYDFYGITPESFITMGNKTYYFDTDCRMAVGQQIIDGALYLFDDYGALVREEDLSEANGLVYQDWKAYYYIDGVMQKSGWYQVDSDWYYLNDYGAGVVNCWRLKDGEYAYLGSDGKMKTNCWVEDYGNWYYVEEDGGRCTSTWKELNGHWYWFGGSGKAAESEWLQLDGKWYYFTESHEMARDYWIEEGSGWETKWYYVGPDGVWQPNPETD